MSEPAGDNRPTVFLSWSGRDSDAMAAAVSTLIEVAFCGRVVTWQSSRDLEGNNWQSTLQSAVKRARVGVMALGPDSLASLWLMFEAGAFYSNDGAFVVGCGVDPQLLKGTPLHNLQLWEARDQSAMRRLLRSIGKALGDPLTAFDERLDTAWPAYRFALDTIHAKFQARAAEEARVRAAQTEARLQEEAAAAKAAQEAAATKTRQAEAETQLKIASAAKAASQRAWRQVATAVVALAAVAGAASWAWTHRPVPPAPPPCDGKTGSGLADCRWKDYVDEATRRGGNATKNLKTQIERRPFAVIAQSPSCDTPPAGDGIHIAWQGAKGRGWAIPVLFARSGSETGKNMFSAVALHRANAPRRPSPAPFGSRTEAGHGDTVVLKEAECEQLADGAVTVRFIGTLSDDRICPKLTDVHKAFAGSPYFEREFATWLDSFPLGDPRLGERVREWAAGCGLK